MIFFHAHGITKQSWALWARPEEYPICSGFLRRTTVRFLSSFVFCSELRPCLCLLHIILTFVHMMEWDRLLFEPVERPSFELLTVGHLLRTAVCSQFCGAVLWWDLLWFHAHGFTRQSWALWARPFASVPSVHTPHWDDGNGTGTISMTQWDTGTNTQDTSTLVESERLRHHSGTRVPNHETHIH